MPADGVLLKPMRLELFLGCALLQRFSQCLSVPGREAPAHIGFQTFSILVEPFSFREWTQTLE